MARSGLLDFIAIRDDTDFQTVLDYYQLKPERPGDRQVKIHCPFHDDASPSCSINLEKGIFNCFGCSAEGNVLDFIRLKDGLGNKETFKAAQKALKIIGASAEEYRKGDDRDKKPKNASKSTKKAQPARNSSKPVKSRDDDSTDAQGDAKTSTANPVIDVSLTLDHDHEFLASRNVSPDLAAEFGIGHCRTGIMKNRIAIPIHNSSGQLVAYAGRYANDEMPSDQIKYKLPKGFEKSLELFNLHRAAAMGKSYVVIVEGYWSVFRLHAAGVPTVSLMGTSISDHQTALLAAAGFRHAILILDGDDAGREATPAALSFLAQAVYVKTVILPEGVKPDTMSDDIVHRFQR